MKTANNKEDAVYSHCDCYGQVKYRFSFDHWNLSRLELTRD